MNTRHYGIVVIALLMAGTGSAVADSSNEASDASVLIVTASNTTSNSLLIYNQAGNLVATLPTRGLGGVSGNSGGIAQNQERLAVVNFKSDNVSVFLKDTREETFVLERVVPAYDSPVSVALSEDHLYILTTTHVESHAIGPKGAATSADGLADLLIGDGSAAQVGILPNQLIFTEKSNQIETVALNGRNAITGTAKSVANIPANVAAPFGLITNGNDAYVSIAHANEISLVRNDAVVTITGSGTKNAPCWLALDGSFLYSSNSPSHSVSRFVVYGPKIVQDLAVAATFSGDPTDITYGLGLAAVVDADATTSRVSVFNVDKDGNLALRQASTINNPATNGIAIVDMRPQDDH